MPTKVTTRFFVTNLNGRPQALARIRGQRADRLLRGGKWEEYPDLVRLLFMDDWNWDEIDSKDAKPVEQQLRADR